MKKNVLAVAGLMMAGLGVGVGTTWGGEGVNGQAASRPTSRPGMERHPEIRRALMGLREAKKSLEAADHDFDGHRAAALKDVEAGINELEEALKADKK